MRRRAAALLALLAPLGSGAAPPAAAPAPRRIVSLNLCADQYLLLLADRAQIAGLTGLARDPAMSAQAARADGLTLTGGSAEEVLALRPDLVLAAPGHKRRTVAAIGGARFATLDLLPAESWADIRTQLRRVAAAVGHPDRGEALIRATEARLARVPRDAGRGRVAAYYQRRGFLTGTGTQVDELMGRVGLVNLARRLGKPALARVSLEEMALARPAYLVTDDDARVIDQGTALVHHPLLGRIPRLRLRRAWTVCGSPDYATAAEALARQLRAGR